MGRLEIGIGIDSGREADLVFHLFFEVIYRFWIAFSGKEMIIVHDIYNSSSP